ncbi:nitrate reductase molybdenum cofactor assembly chaperone [Nocardia sp. IFM 10818]
MRTLLSRKESAADRALRYQVIRQSASLLLSYPDERWPDRLAIAERLIDNLSGAPAELLSRTLTALRGVDLLTAEQHFVDTFDLRRESTMYLTYWTSGDTRNRGAEIHAFAQAYRDAGLPPPLGETPDYLPVVLEFAATVDPEAGERLLTAHRVPIDVLRTALAGRGSPYAHTIAAVCETLPAVTDREAQRAQQLSLTGPPAESIGLEPFTLTVPPRRATRAARPEGAH